MARTECRTSAKLEHVLAGKSEPFTKDDVFLLFTLQDKVRQPSNHTLRQWSLTLCFVDRTERKPWLLVLCLSMLMASGEATSAAPLYFANRVPNGPFHPHLACSTPCVFHTLHAQAALLRSTNCEDSLFTLESARGFRLHATECYASFTQSTDPRAPPIQHTDCDAQSLTAHSLSSVQDTHSRCKERSYGLSTGHRIAAA
eukprot:3435600-Rhodomonas_salina.19